MEQAAETHVLRRERLLRFDDGARGSFSCSSFAHHAVLAGKDGVCFKRLQAKRFLLSLHPTDALLQTNSWQTEAARARHPFLDVLVWRCNCGLLSETKTRLPALVRVDPTTGHAPATRRTTHCVLPSPLKRKGSAQALPPKTVQLRQQLRTSQFVLT